MDGKSLTIGQLAAALVLVGLLGGAGIAGASWVDGRIAIATRPLLREACYQSRMLREIAQRLNIPDTTEPRHLCAQVMGAIAREER